MPTTKPLVNFLVEFLGRGGFGEVYGCRKADTGKMYAMKCLDKKRIKMKQGETLALNERIMLSLVSTGQDCPFIVCMTYAFHTQDKLCFILGNTRSHHHCFALIDGAKVHRLEKPKAAFLSNTFTKDVLGQILRLYMDVQYLGHDLIVGHFLAYEKLLTLLKL